MLKNHTNTFAGLPKLALAHGCYILTIHCYHTTGRALQKIDTPYQGGFASTAKTNDTINFSLINMEADILNSLYRARGTVIDFLNMG